MAKDAPRDKCVTRGIWVNELVKFVTLRGLTMNVRAIIEWDEVSQLYSATCPELNFVSSFGESRDEAIAQLKDAIALMLEPIPEVIV